MSTTISPDAVISAQLEASAARAALRDMKNQLVSLKRELEHERGLRNAHKSPLHKRARAAAGAPAATSSPTTADATPSSVSTSLVSASAAVEEDGVAVPKTPGASEQQQLLRAATMGDVPHDAACPICFESLSGSGQATFTTTCGHAFHFRCIKQCVLLEHKGCPMCRRAFMDMTPPRTPLAVRGGGGAAAGHAMARDGARTMPADVEGNGSAARLSQQLYDALRISGDPDESSSPPRAATPVEESE